MMIKVILDELNLLRDKYRFSIAIDGWNIFIAYLIYLKYLCDKGKYNYEEVIDSDDLYDITTEVKYLKRYIIRYMSGDMLSINRIMVKIKDIDTKELLIGFLDYIDKAIYFHSDSDKVCYIGFDLYNYNYYDDKGNSTYIINDVYQDNYNIFKVFDEILGINNNYICDKDTDIKDFDYVYLYDDIPRYRTRNNNIFEVIYEYIKNNNNVILCTNYNKISNFSSGRIVSKYLKTIILNNSNTTTLLFNDDNSNGNISIINYDERIGSTSKLYNIIKSNRKQKDILVKINYKDFVDNNMRIGFKLYQIEKPNKIKDINKIVDENTRYLKRLNSINNIVEQEINILLNR